MSGVSDWFCCLAFPEKAVFTAVAESFLATAPPVMPKAAYDALWLLFPLSGEARQNAFLTIYQLAIATIEGGGAGELIEVVVPADLGVWIVNVAFVSSPDALCSGGCGLSKPPYAT